MPQLLRSGMSGENVRELQAALNFHVRTLGPLRLDGVFGRDTEARVRHFQSVNALRVDGVVGPATEAKLYEMVHGVIGVDLNRSDRYVRQATWFASPVSPGAAVGGERARGRVPLFGVVPGGLPPHLPIPLGPIAPFGLPDKPPTQPGGGGTSRGVITYKPSQWEGSFVISPFQPMDPKQKDHRFTLELTMPWPNDGDPGWMAALSLSGASGQPLDPEWDIKAYIKVPFVKLPLGPALGKPYFKAGMDAEHGERPKTFAAAGAALRVDVLRTSSGNPLLRIGADAEFKVQKSLDDARGEVKGVVQGVFEWTFW